jgi:hypothetical protein
MTPAAIPVHGVSGTFLPIDVGPRFCGPCDVDAREATLTVIVTSPETG